MYFRYTLFLITTLLTSAAIASDTATQIAEELGLPNEITITKRALALFAWQELAREYSSQSVDESCRLTRMINSSNQRLPREKRIRIDQLLVGTPIPLEKCESEFQRLNEECKAIAREFFVEKHIEGMKSKDSVVETLVYIARLCPTSRMLGYEIDAHKIHENLKRE
jgi:hypothetical protein